MSDQQRLKISHIDGVTVVQFRENAILDPAHVEQLGDELMDLVEKRAKVLLDFAGIEFLSSAVLGKLIALERALKAQQGVLKLCGIPPEIYVVFETTKLTRLMDIRRDQSEALASF